MVLPGSRLGPGGRPGEPRGGPPTLVPVASGRRDPEPRTGPLPRLPSLPQAKQPPWWAPRSPAVEMRGLLPVELAVGRAAVLGGSEALEAIVDELGVLLVEVLVGHHI